MECLASSLSRIGKSVEWSDVAITSSAEGDKRDAIAAVFGPAVAAPRQPGTKN